MQVKELSKTKLDLQSAHEQLRDERVRIANLSVALADGEGVHQPARGVELCDAARCQRPEAPHAVITTPPALPSSLQS